MAKQQRKITDYIRAFSLFSSGGGQIFHTRPFGRHALINDGVYVYQVSHFGDLVADYKNSFRSGNESIYTSFPGALWDRLMDEKVTVSIDDFSIDLYQAWKGLNDPGSIGEIHRLIQQFHDSQEDLVACATELDGSKFLPVIARAIKSQYSSAEFFFADCVRYMTTEFTEQLGDGQVFVRIQSEVDPDTQAYFIYTVEEDF